MTDVRDDRWHRCKAQIGQWIEAEDAAAWLAPLNLDDVRPDRIVLSGIPNSFFKNRIASRFRPLILEGLRDAFPDISFASEPDLQLEIGPAGPERSSSVPSGLSKRSSRGSTADGAQIPSCQGEAAFSPSGIKLTPDLSPLAGPLESPGNSSRMGSTEGSPEGGGPPEPDPFGGVLESSGNREALQFLRRVTAKPGKTFNPLLLVGATGLGKSHLLHHAAQALESGHPEWNVLVRTGEEFKNEVLEAITRKAMKPFRDLYRGADALVVDGLDYLLVSPKAQEELIHTFDTLVKKGCQVLFSSVRFPRALDGMNDALRSRLEMGLIVELGSPDPALRRALVAKRAAEQGGEFPPEIADMLARRITQNLRQLEGAVVRLTAHAALYGEAITPAFAERYAKPFFDVAPSADGLPVNRESILERVADRFGLTVRSIKGRSRTAKVVSARQVAIHLLRALGAYSYAEIGATLGHRSHSTIVHAHQQLQSRFAHDSLYESKVMDLARGLGE